MSVMRQTARRWFPALVGLVLLPLGAAVAAGIPARYIAGEHYRVLDTPAEPAPADGGIEVIEFFLYSCSHCYAFDPKLQAWLKGQPADVSFRRVPATFGPGPVHARMFYTAKALGVLERLHDEIFNTIHQRHQPLWTPTDIRAFFVAHGVDAAAFDQVFNSDEVAQAVAHATELMKAYGVLSVPALVVAGKYMTSPTLTGDFATMLDVASYLIERERR